VPGRTTTAAEARSFEITKLEGSSPCAIMACLSAGSLRLNPAEKPPTVDCSMIDMAVHQSVFERSGLRL